MAWRKAGRSLKGFGFVPEVTACVFDVGFSLGKGRVAFFASSRKCKKPMFYLSKSYIFDIWTLLVKLFFMHLLMNIVTSQGDPKAQNVDFT